MTATKQTILAIETATGPCSVAILRNGGIAWQDGFSQPGSQAGKLMPLVMDGLKQTGLSFFDLDMICASVGPGSFTGIRIGLATARGIAFAANITMKGYHTLTILAQMAGAKEGEAILACLNAGKGDVYWQVFSKDVKPLTLAHIATAEQAVAQAKQLTEPRQLVGISNIVMDDATVTWRLAYPQATALAQLAANDAPSEALHPFYIRPPDAALPSADKKLRMSE